MDYPAPAMPGVKVKLFSQPPLFFDPGLQFLENCTKDRPNMFVLLVHSNLFPSKLPFEEIQKGSHLFGGKLYEADFTEQEASNKAEKEKRRPFFNFFVITNGNDNTMVGFICTAVQIILWFNTIVSIYIYIFVLFLLNDNAMYLLYRDNIRCIRQNYFR